MGIDKTRTKWFPKPEYDSDGLQEKINQTVNGYNSAGLDESVSDDSSECMNHSTSDSELEVVDVEKVMMGARKDVYLFKLSEKNDS